jgi:hypothetical protein
MPAVAHQYAIRQRLAVDPPAAVCLDIRAAQVRPISWQAAAAIITCYEPMPAVAPLTFGLFLGPALAAAVAYGPDYAANLRASDASVIALLRGACAPWAPRNCASALIRRSMRLLPPEYKVVTAFSDRSLGERGVIYRAAGFICAGASRGGRRVLIHYQGKVLSERSARRKFGTSSATQLAALGLKVETVPRRLRYFAFRDASARRQEARAA